MKKVAFPAAVAIAAAFAMVAAVGASASPSAAHQAKVVGHVYVNDNTAGVNTVAGFDRHPNGSLTPIPGSPFSTGGAGPGHGIASQGSLQLSPDRRFLLAVDAGSNQVSVLRIAHDGSLKVADAVSSNGSDPVSIAVAHSFVYVANADAATPNYTGFTLSHWGRLHAIPGSTVALPAGSQPGDVLFNRDGKKLVGTRVATSEIDSFTVGQNGLLTAAPGSPFAHQTGAYGQFGSEFSPTKPNQLFVSNAHTAANGPAPGSVSAYNDAADGTLTAIGAPLRSSTPGSRPAGSRSATTGISCSPSIPPRLRSRATRSDTTGHSPRPGTPRSRTARVPRMRGSRPTARRSGSSTRAATASMRSRSRTAA